jgi:tetratricopeptide (TPR) repeat protein
MGLLRSAQGRYEDAADFHRRALDTGRRASLRPAPVARIEMSLSYDEASLGHAGEAQRLADEADDIVVRAMGAEHPIRIGYLAARAFASGADGDVHQALALDQQAIALAEGVAPDDDAELQVLYNDVCTDLYDLGDCTGARPYCAKAVESSRRASGPDSQYLSYAYGSLGDVLSCLHDYDDAAADFESSVAIFERTATVRDPGYVHSLLGAGQNRLLEGKASLALPLLEKSLAIVPGGEGKLESEKKDAAGVRFALAQALWQTGSRSPRVAELARTAADIDERSGNGQGAAEVRAWLQSHR